MQHNEQSKLVLGGEGDKTKVRYANFDEEMIGMTTTVTNEDSGGAFGSQVSWSRLTISGHNDNGGRLRDILTSMILDGHLR